MSIDGSDQQVPGSTIMLVVGTLLVVVGFLLVASLFSSRRQVDPVEVASAGHGRDRVTSEDADIRRAAAALFTERVQGSPLRGWNVRGRAVGPRCEVLLVEIDVNMDPPMVEALHRGDGFYGSVFPGGVRKFSFERTFAGTAYIDARGTAWYYGAASTASPLANCV